LNEYPAAMPEEGREIYQKGSQEDKHPHKNVEHETA
jgi:hypothetical protein